MPIDNGLGAGHELDNAVISTAKEGMKSIAEPLLKALFVSKSSAERGIAKRQAWLDGVAELAAGVRDAYDAGDAAALKPIQAKLDAYGKSLLRAKRR